MNRDEALSLLKQHLKNKNLVKHSLAVETCMRALAERLNEITEKSPELHTKETVKILEDKGVEQEIIRTIQAHAGQVECKNAMEWAIFAIDPLTGLIIAATLMHPSKKLGEIDLGFVERRYKEKSFARGARREDIEQIKNIGLDLDEFISICIGAMQGISGDLGL